MEKEYTNKPRYSRMSDFIDLAVFMQSKTQGITIKDIELRYGVSRRTAVRMRDGLMNILPAITELPSEGAQKRFGFMNYSINELISFSHKEIANIEQLQRRTTNEEMKNELGKTVEKLKIFSKKRNVNQENRIELIMQTEGYALRQMPQYKIAPEILDVIRPAVQNSFKVTGIYHEKERLLEPLGMIYGEKIYLIAREQAKGDGIYNYLLHKFSNLKTTEESFDRQGFDLIKYSELSFGVYHGEILNVKLKFDKEIAEDALTYNFHPTQRIKQEDDGTVTVRFKASGSIEIIRHVFKWGKHCKIAAPKSLYKEYKAYLRELLSEMS